MLLVNKRHRSTIPSRIYFDANHRIIEAGIIFKGRAQSLSEALAFRKRVHFSLFAQVSPQLYSLTGNLPPIQEARFKEFGIVESEMLGPMELLKGRQRQQQLQTQKMEQSRQVSQI